MDLKEYFKPNSEEKYQDQNNWQSTQLGHQIYSHNLNQFPEYKFCEIAIFNVREYEGSLNLTTDKECKIMLIELEGTQNTGGKTHRLTAENNQWI